MPLKLPLTRGLFAIVDDKDYPALSAYKWLAWPRTTPGKFNVYRVVSTDPFRMLVLHEQLMGKRDGFTVDHVNRDSLDNRRCNLRWATKTQQAANRNTRLPPSGFRGVTCARGGKFIAAIGANWDIIGYYETALLAAEAYNAAARARYGEFAVLNDLSGATQLPPASPLLSRPPLPPQQWKTPSGTAPPQFSPPRPAPVRAAVENVPMKKEGSSMKADPKETCLYFRNKVAYFRKRITTPNGKKDHWEAIGEIDVDDARRIVREKRKAAEHEDYLERWDLRRLRSDVSTFPELFAAYKEWSAGARIAERTVRENESCLRRIVRAARGLAAEEGSMSVLDGALVSSYESARIRAVKEQATREGWSAERTALELDTAQTTIFSTVRQARSVFKKKCHSSEPYRRLKFPAKLKEFMDQSVDGSTVADYTPPSAAVIKAVTEGITKLRHTDPAMWLAAMLEINAAARRGTAAEARWDWFADENRFCGETGKPLISLRIGLAKGNRSAPAMYLDLYHEMLAARVGDAPFVVPGETHAERQEVFTRLCAFLRGLGLERRQPNHELRKLYTDEILSRFGTEAALAATGHSSEKMLRPYTQRRAKHALRLA